MLLLWFGCDGDGVQGEVQKRLLERELENVGIRLNQTPPNIYFKKKSTGGVSFNSTVPLTHVDPRLIQTVLHEYRIFNCEILFRGDYTVDELIDVIEGNRVYMKAIYVRVGGAFSFGSGWGGGERVEPLVSQAVGVGIYCFR